MSAPWPFMLVARTSATTAACALTFACADVPASAGDTEEPTSRPEAVDPVLDTDVATPADGQPTPAFDVAGRAILRVTRTDSAGIEIVTVRELPALNDSAWQWRLHLVREIAGRGENPGDPVVLYDPRSAARFDDGTLVAFDNGPQRIVVFAADADTVLARFATTGQGPGEIRTDYVALLPGPGDTVTVVEPWGNRRIHRFSRAGRLLSETSLPVGLTAAQTVGPSATEITVRYFQSAAGEFVDSVGILDTRTGVVRTFAPLPERVPAPVGRQPLFHPISLSGAVPSGGVITGMTDSGKFRLHDADGRLRREIRLPMTAREVTRASVSEALEEVASFTGGSAAELGPERIHSHHRIAFRVEAVTDSVFALVHKGRSSPAEDPLLDSEETAWRLYDVTGVPAGVIRFPVGFTPWNVRDGYLFGVQEDSLGAQTLRVYRVSPPPGR